MSEALKPCPFCGAPGVWKAPWAVGCYVCNVHIPIEDWNRRAEVEHLKMELAGALDAEQTNARNAASYCVQLAAAKDQVVELEGEKKQLQQVVDLLYAREAYLMKGRDALQQQVDALQQRVHLCAGYDALVAENERLEIALVRYGDHDNGCPVLSSTTVTACECGYRETLTGGEAG